MAVSRAQRMIRAWHRTRLPHSHPSSAFSSSFSSSLPTRSLHLLFILHPSIMPFSYRRNTPSSPYHKSTQPFPAYPTDTFPLPTQNLPSLNTVFTYKRSLSPSCLYFSSLPTYLFIQTAFPTLSLTPLTHWRFIPASRLPAWDSTLHLFQPL